MGTVTLIYEMFLNINGDDGQRSIYEVLGCRKEMDLIIFRPGCFSKPYVPILKKYVVVV